MTDKKKTRKDLENIVIKKAIVDTQFRQSLLANPRRTLESELAKELPGSSLPGDLEVKAFQEPENGLYLVVPHVPTSEISDDQLEQVAGGIFTVTWSR